MSDEKVELKFTNLIHEMMLRTIGFGAAFRNNYEVLSNDLKLAVTEYYDGMIKEAKSPEQIKYLKKQKKYKLNKYVKDTQIFLKELDKAVDIYKENSKESDEIIEAFVDSLDAVASEIVTVNDDGVQIKTISLKENE